MGECKITAAVPTYNRHQSLASTIDSLIAQSIDQDEYEILIVDNSPDPGPGEEFMLGYRQVANLRYVYQSLPGLSRARNRAIKECRSEFIAFIDDDAVADSEWLAEICLLFGTQGSEQVGIVGGPVIPVWEAPRPPWMHSGLLGFVTIVDWSDEVVELEDKWLAGTNIAYRMSAVENMVGFREDLGRIGAVRMANDEIEFSNRVRQRGWRVIYSPRIKVSHRIPGKRLKRTWLRRRNMWQSLSEALLKGEDLDDSDHWRNLARTCASLGVDVSGLEAVFEPTDDPDRFYQQCAAIRALMHVLYRGGS